MTTCAAVAVVVVVVVAAAVGVVVGVGEVEDDLSVGLPRLAIELLR